MKKSNILTIFVVLSLTQITHQHPQICADCNVNGQRGTFVGPAGAGRTRYQAAVYPYVSLSASNTTTPTPSNE